MTDDRRNVTEHIRFRIGKDLKAETYRKDFTWKDLIETKDILPTDIVIGVEYKKEQESGMFSMKMEDELEYYYTPTIIAKRIRPETDEEYFTRKSQEQKRIEKTEEQERLEYLRLKAKFEPDSELK